MRQWNYVLFLSILFPTILCADPTLPPVEIRTSDFRISDMLPDGDPNTFSEYPSIAYNPGDTAYLVVFQASHTGGARQIYGQFVNAETGELQGSRFLISEMGSEDNTSYHASKPHVVWNSTKRHFLVVWSGDINTGGLVNDEYEIWGRVVNTDGTFGGNQFRISEMGGTGTTSIWTIDPRVAYNSDNDEYMVVWTSNTEDGSSAGGYEIWARRLAYDPSDVLIPVGTNSRISQLGPDGNSAFNSFAADIVYNSTQHEYFFVYTADTNADGYVDNEFEIYGQSLDGEGNITCSPLIFSINSPANGNAAYYGWHPALAFNSRDNQYMLVWSGNDGYLAVGKTEIWGSMISGEVRSTIVNPFLISSSGQSCDTCKADYPAVAYDSLDNRFMVSWIGSNNTSGDSSDEFEAWGRVYFPSGSPVAAQARYSNMGPSGDANYDVFTVALAHSPRYQHFLLVWAAENNTGSLVDGESEIYGQFIGDSTDVSISYSDDQASAPNSIQRTYTANVTNLGPHLARALLLEANFPLQAEVVSASGDQWTCYILAGSSENMVNCDMTPLTSGSSSPVSIVVRHAGDYSGSMSVQASAYAITFDPNLSNNTASDVTEVFVPTPTPIPTSTPTQIPSSSSTPTPSVTATPTMQPTPEGNTYRCTLSTNSACQRTVRAGKTCSFTATLKNSGRAAAGKSVLLQTKVGSAQFSTAKSSTTKSNGKRDFSIKVRRTTSYRAVFGNTLCVSRTVKVKVR